MLRRVLFCAALSLPLFAAQSRDAVIDQTLATLTRVVDFEQVAISPDGATVAYVSASPGTPAQIHAGSARITAKPKGDSDETDIAWSPDSKQLAFVSGALHVANANGTNVRALTTINASFSDPKWSPDGKKIAVLTIENASRKGGALVAMTPPSGDVETQVEEQRVAIIDVATKSLQFATPANMYIFDYDWSPDSKSLVTEATFGSGDDNYWVARLYRFDLGDAAPHELYKPVLQLAEPRWSPDGKSIAFIEGLMSDAGNNGGDVFVMPAAGGTPVNVTAGLNASPATIEWLAGSSELLMGENVNGLAGLARVAADGSGVKLIWSGAEKIARTDIIGASVAADGVTTAVIRQSFTRPPDVWSGPIGEWKQVTHANDGVQPLWAFKDGCCIQARRRRSCR